MPQCRSCTQSASKRNSLWRARTRVCSLKLPSVSQCKLLILHSCQMCCRKRPFLEQPVGADRSCNMFVFRCLSQRHDECADQEPSECTCGPHRDHILPPWAIYPVIKVRPHPLPMPWRRWGTKAPVRGSFCCASSRRSQGQESWGCGKFDFSLLLVYSGLLFCTCRRGQTM